jgi:transposase
MLADADRAVLEERARAYTSPFAVVVRAKIVLLAAQGVANTAIAARLDVDVDVVSRWRRRFVAEGLAGLGDRRRCGRPRSFPARVVTEVKAAQAVVEGLA